MRIKRKIAAKLALINGLSALAVLILSGAIILGINNSQLQQGFEQRMDRQARLVADTLTAAMVFADWDTANELTQALLSDPAVCAAKVLDAQGTTVVELAQPCAATTTRQNGLHLTTGLLGEPVQYLSEHSINMSDSAVGSISVAATNYEVRNSLADLFGKVLATTVCALILGFIITIRSQSRVVRPIVKLTEMVRLVRRTGNYNLRAEHTGSDEIAQLTTHVNEMLELIAERDHFLADEVAARTADIQQKSEELQREMKRGQEIDRALIESQERFAGAFQSSPIGMAIIDQVGALTQTNSALTSLLNIEDDHPGKVADYICAESVDEFHRSFRDLWSHKIDTAKLTIACYGPDNSKLTCEVSLSGLAEIEGNFSYAILQIEDVTEANRLTQELAYQANHDALTGLGNRRVFEQQLVSFNEQSLRQPFSLALLDLDQFKIVNDTCGHEAGDVLLCQVSTLLLDSVRENDLVVRLGGDEFAIILANCNSSNAFPIAEKIRKAVESMTFHWQGDNFRIGTSIGLLTVDRPQNDVSDLLRSADSACFAAKDSGRNRVYQILEDDPTLAKTKGDMHWVNRIQKALDQDEFILYAQPIVPLRPSAEALRLEVLIRLRDFKKRTLIPPGAFLAPVERYGLSSRLDRWVVTTLLAQLGAYVEVFQDNRSYWVNLSGNSLSDQQFLHFLEDAISKAHLPEGAVNFEVTETAVISNLTVAAKAMERLQEFGCRFALDDFGTGLASYGYLRQLPIDFIKIDGTFVRNITTDEVDRIFVKSIIDIASAMGIKSVAEFVEDDATAILLSEMGADYGQGFGLGRPAPLLPDRAYRSAGYN